MSWTNRQQGILGYSVGWSTSRADLATCVGSDKNGYGFRDVNGAKVHAGVRNYYGIPFGERDLTHRTLPQPRHRVPYVLCSSQVLRMLWVA